MPNFAYEGEDKGGAVVQGMIEASDQQEAIVLLRRQGIKASKVVLSRTGLGVSRKKSTFSFGRIRQKQITELTRQLSTLVNAGLPIVKSLNIIETQLPKGRLKNVIMDVADNVQSGSTLSESLSRYPRVFDKLFINMVKAGELGGALDVVLDRLAEFKEKSMRLKRRVISAIIYPAVILSLAVLILLGLMIFIVPQFEKMFVEVKAELPILTKMLLTIARFVGSGSFLVVAPVAVIIFVLVFMAIKASDKGRYALDSMVLRLPIFGPIIRKTAVARFTRTLATMSSSGVSILESLTVIKDATGNAVVGKAIGHVYEAIKEGETIAKPMRASKVFDEIVVNMINVGEETGELDKMLVKVAESYEEEVDTAVGSLVSIIEPLLILFMGVIVLFIVVSLFLPLVSIMNAVKNTK